MARNYDEMLIAGMAVMQACTQYMVACEDALTAEDGPRDEHKVEIGKGKTILAVSINALKEQLLDLDVFASEMAEETFAVIIDGSMSRLKGEFGDHKAIKVLTSVVLQIVDQLKVAILTKEDVELSTYL